MTSKISSRVSLELAAKSGCRFRNRGAAMSEDMIRRNYCPYMKRFCNNGDCEYDVKVCLKGGKAELLRSLVRDGKYTVDELADIGSLWPLTRSELEAFAASLDTSASDKELGQ